MALILPGMPRAPQVELYSRFRQLAAGFRNNDIAGAAAIMVIDALSHDHATRRIAEQRLEEVIAFMRSSLNAKYNASGKPIKGASEPTPINGS